MSKTDPRLAEQATLLEELARRLRENRLANYTPYPKQRAFHALGASKRERMFLAGNQQGKTFSGSMEMAAHLTGLYPDDWPGRRFPRNVRAWAAGVTSESTRDTVQRLLLGPLGAQGTGAIPKHTIDAVRMGRGIADQVDTILVRHKSGDTSQLAFKSYEKGREKFQGETLDVVWLDEEPASDIYSECLARIAARNGLVYLTATPLLGMSDVVRKFLSDENADRAYVQASIEDALHIPPDERAKIIAGYPEHERDARVRGVPMLGSGRVFQLAESAISIEPFALPRHWPRICGLDIGIEHPTAAAWLAWDRDADIVYLYDTHRRSDVAAAVHAAAIRQRGVSIPVAWPHDAANREPGSGEAIASLYRSLGLNMLRERATFPDGSASVEAGLIEMQERMQTGRFKVFRHLADWFDEFRTYHRKDGKLVKLHDDLISATRYATMMLRFARVEDAGMRRRRPTTATGMDYDVFNPGGDTDERDPRKVARHVDYNPFE